jgi:hypothetical protein
MPGAVCIGPRLMWTRRLVNNAPVVTWFALIPASSKLTHESLQSALCQRTKGPVAGTDSELPGRRWRICSVMSVVAWQECDDASMTSVLTSALFSALVSSWCASGGRQLHESADSRKMSLYKRAIAALDTGPVTYLHVRRRCRQAPARLLQLISQLAARASAHRTHAGTAAAMTHSRSRHRSRQQPSLPTSPRTVPHYHHAPRPRAGGKAH